MDRDRISRLAHARHPIAAPLDDASVAALLEAAVPPGNARALDLGCGRAEWLLRALRSHDELRATGVDTSDEPLAEARLTAARLGLADRLELHQEDAAIFAPWQPFDLVLSVGAAHAFGGLRPTLDALERHLAPGGRALIGDGFWQRPPSAEGVEMLVELADLATTLDQVTAAGWTPVGGHLSTRAELDDYEWAWTGTLAAWALDHPDDPDHVQALTTANRHRDEWVRGYRDSFGFVCLVLRRTGLS